MHQEDIQRGVAHLRASDPILRESIDEVGPFTLRLERNRFRMLVRSIVSQQISTSAARSIRKRFENLITPATVTAPRVAALDKDQLRSAGLSNQKATYILDLAEKVGSGEVRLRNTGRMTDEEVVSELTKVKGIGHWTAQMFLIFSLGRLDVLPHGDLGIRTAIQNMYELDDLPDRKTSEEIALPWRPYASLASWYCWRSLELTRSKEVNGRNYPA